MQVKVDIELKVGDLIDLKKKDFLRVNHEYQRGLRWTALQKQMFLDSIFRDYSIPAFYFHVTKTSAASMSNTYYDIVDGQQRVDAIYTYSENAFQLIDPAETSRSRFPNFVKDKACPWASLRYADLPEELQDKLKNTKVVVYLLETDDEDEVRDLFIRLQGGTALTPQDKRDSWPGKFTEFILRVGGKSQVPKWFGLPLFRDLVKGNESRRRQLAAQAYMLFHSVRQEKEFCDIKSANIDEFYHQNVGFDEKSSDAKRFEDICERLRGALDGKPKVVGHHLLHSVLLYDWMKDEYAKGWEQNFATRLHEFERRCKAAADAQRTGDPNEFARYWPSYAQWTQTQADIGRTIQRRHAFFAAELVQLLKPTRLDSTRDFSDAERQIVFFRDSQRCQHCMMLGDEHVVDWPSAEIHHVIPHVEGGPTTTENAALMHRDCHPKVKRRVDDFHDWWRSRHGHRQSDDADPVRVTGRRTRPPHGTEVEFIFQGERHAGTIMDGRVLVEGQTYKTFSEASGALTRTSRNGWRDWSIRLPDSEEWVSADKWRKGRT